MNPSICAIILAAGTSSRMGKTKQMLSLGNDPILEHVINCSLHENFSEVIAVIGHEANTIKENILIDSERFRWVVNESYLSGQSSSLKVGIESLKEVHPNLMVFLGDLPFLSTKTIRTIYQHGAKRLEETDAPFMIRPMYNGEVGHPVFFGNIDRHLFARLQGDTGGKAIMHQISDRIFLKVEDEGILFDVDTLADYQKAKIIAKHLF
ncbi:nucleotidyltransferase family protein [Sporosarcina sp. ACRSM]|uniref:nucleotidyltransferase family protein n=1 Tax=Sporosarcina sp. ACRSM TaxID=2918216 RepID=UPI001EF5B89D|nr:nucleotidyltransferase family protein [Sporosarcina sp. ACRSM]MCG7334695.1 nucleotidyltransferase family protein [Sporosarcina sp. ACRSM]